ncbi:MAG: hypothetical protein KGS72_20530 [Cyanobacteria bacterium REEB67]|nr:hypothetical protein [Cyanobacteria bacterium REEB67]
MLIETNNSDDKKDYIYTGACMSGLIDRECERLLDKEKELMPASFATDSPLLNFFSSKVTTEKVRHETEVQHAALAHWRHSSDQVAEQYFHPVSAIGGVPQPEILETQYSLDSTLPPEVVSVQRKLQREPAVTRHDITLMQPRPATTGSQPVKTASAEIRHYRRPKSMTFTNLLARAKALLKA